MDVAIVEGEAPWQRDTLAFERQRCPHVGHKRGVLCIPAALSHVQATHLKPSHVWHLCKWLGPETTSFGKEGRGNECQGQGWKESGKEGNLGRVEEDGIHCGQKSPCLRSFKFSCMALTSCLFSAMRHQYLQGCQRQDLALAQTCACP